MHGARRNCRAQLVVGEHARPAARAARRSWTSRDEVLEEAVELVEVAVGDRAGTRPGRRRPRRGRSPARRAAARRGTARRARARARGRRARSARRARRRRGTRGRRSRRSGRATRARGTASPTAPTSRSLRVQARRGRPPGRRAGRRRRDAVEHVSRPQNPSCTVGRMQPLRWERRPDGLRAPALVAAFQGWNDAGDAASSRADVHRQRAQRAAASRRSTPRSSTTSRRRGRRSASSTASAAQVDWPEVEVHAARAPGAPRDLVLLTGHEPSLPLAHVLRHDHRPRRGARRAVGRHARLAAGRRPALAADGHHRPGVRRGADRARRPHAVELPGPDRDRRRPPRRVPAARHPVRLAVGGRAALRRGRRRTRRARSRSCASSRASSASRSTRPSSRTAAGEYERQVNRAVESDPDVQAFVERLERAAAAEEEEPGPGLPAVGRRARARVPALPAPARRRGPADRPGPGAPAVDCDRHPPAARAHLGRDGRRHGGLRGDHAAAARPRRRVRPDARARPAC